MRKANCEAVEVVDTDSSGPFAAVAIVAERDIAVGEELLFDCARRFQLDASPHELIAPRTPNAYCRTARLLALTRPQRPVPDGKEYWDELGVARFTPQRLVIDYF